MKLSDDRFFGPQRITKVLVEYPPYEVKVKAVLWGYETKDAIYDVVYLDRPVWVPGIKAYINKYYVVNGVPALEPSSIHKAVEKKFNLE